MLELTTGVKYLFALVNASQPLLEERDELITRGNSTLQDFTDWILNVGENGGLDLITGTTAVPAGQDRGFMMTSEDGMTRVTLEPTLDNEETQTVILTVGRAMAKVSVASELTDEQQPNGELTDMTYKVVNNPYEMYVVPSLTNNIVATPYSKKITGNSANGLYFESPGQLAGNYTPISKKDALTRVYCMEHATTQPVEEHATTVILKGTYVPHVLYKANGTELFTGYKKGGHFWRIANIQDGQRISYEENITEKTPRSIWKKTRKPSPIRKGKLITLST
ncbi:MAG: hypothetical protein LIP05_11020 [Tannerellaceae bacterium]|nr:hypothetical protein [Tannerellaceae bacterium]